MSTPQSPGEGDRGWPPEGQQPPSYPGNDPSSERSSPPAFGSYPSGNQQYGGYPPQPPAPTGRPGVLIGATVAWIIAGLAAIFLRGVSLLAVSGDPERLQDFANRFEERGFGNVPLETLQTALVALGIIVIVLGVLVITLSLLMLRRQNWARVTVTIVGVLAGLLSLSTILAPLAVIAAIVLQFLSPSNAWFRNRLGHGSYAGW